MITPEELEELVYDALIQKPEIRDYRLGPIEELGMALTPKEYNTACLRALMRYLAESDDE